MIKEVFRYIFLLLVLLLLQFFVFNKINFNGYVNPFVYTMFILVLPFSLKNWHLLLIGFFTGLIVDMFMNTLGLHAAATLVVAFIRPVVLSGVASKADFSRFRSPSMLLGFIWFARYVLLLVLVHHTVLFFMEAFTFHHFGLTIIRIILSTIFTALFILIFEVLRTKKN